MKLKELLEKYTTDGNIDYDQAEEAFQSHVNGVVTKTANKELDKFKNEYTTTFINELGIEANDISGVKSWVETMNGKSDDIKKNSLKLENDYKELKSQYDELFAKNKQTTEFGLLKDIGVTGEKAEFLQYKFSKEVNDEVSFKDLVDKYAKENKTTTFRTTPKDFTNKTTSSPEEALRKRLGK